MDTEAVVAEAAVIQFAVCGPQGVCEAVAAAGVVVMVVVVVDTAKTRTDEESQSQTSRCHVP